MAIQVPEFALKFGFKNDPTGAHVTRTLMLAELRQLLAVCQPAAIESQYRIAVVGENVLLKPTETTRVTSFRILRQLYALRPTVLLFRALRDLWDDDVAAQPLIAGLCACGRDPILRATAELIVDLPIGETITPAQLAAAVKEHLPDRYNLTTLRAAGQNVASSWQQTGHLKGHKRKVRVHTESRPAAVAYALLLGHLSGERGDGLFTTLWVRMLDAPEHLLRSQALAAAQRGWLEYRHAGNVTEISFRHLLRDVGVGVLG